MVNRTLIRRYLACVVVIAATVVIVSFYAGRIVKSNSYRQTEKTLTDFAVSLQSVLKETARGSGPLEDIEEFCRVAGTDATRVTVIRPDGTVIGDSQADIELLDNHGDRPEIKEAFGGEIGVSRRFSKTVRQQLIYVALPLQAFGGRLAVLRTSRPVGDVERELRSAYTRIAVAGVVVLDRNLRIREMNPSACRLLGVEAEQAAGKRLLEVVRNTAFHGFAEKTLESGSPHETTVTLSGQREISLQVHGTLLRERPKAQGETSALMVLVLTDMTRLEILENMRKDFVASVSHELKTPIASVKGYLETLLDGAVDDRPTALKFLRIAAKHADRLAPILEDLLSLSRLEQQAVTNLVDNAIKHSEAGSAVDVSVRAEGSDIAVSVEDRGIGVPEKDLPRVFERFYRVDKARSRDMGGTGLGLAIVKHIALAHGGSVEVKSTLGAGSTFTIRLPGGKASREGIGKTQ